MRIDILTLFPEVFEGYFQASILERAQESDLIQIYTHQIREYTTDKHHVTDEPPYGGGSGMILKPEPIFRAVNAIAPDGVLENWPGDQENRGEQWQPPSRPPLILLTPQGKTFNQKMARELALLPRLILLCGRYEGIDERVRDYLVSAELSIGDYVLTGGELAAMVVVDAVARLIPGVLGAEDAAEQDSFATGLLEGPHYTRPATFGQWTVPDVLRSGHAARIGRWRREQALRRTWQRRPELLLTVELSEEDKKFLAVLAEEQTAK